jgi:hypothetical protein
MKKGTLLSLAAITLISGLGDFVVQPQPAGAESEAGTEAPMYVGGRRGRRGRRYGGGRGQNQNNQQLKSQQKLEAQKLKFDQNDAKQRAKEVGKLQESDIIHTYGKGNTNKTQF